MTKLCAIVTALLFVCPEPSGADVNSEIQIDCSSGAVDIESNILASLSDEVCQEACISEKCDEVTTLEGADSCLRKESLLGCLFDVNLMKRTEPEWCLTTHKENGQDAKAVVAQVSKNDLNDLGNGSLVNDVFLRLGIQNPTVSCNSKEVHLGHSLGAFDKAKCSHEGLPDLEGTFSLANDTILMRVTTMFKGLYGTNQDVVIFAELKDPLCQITVESAQVLFSVEYQTGYAPAVQCMSVESCSGCLQNGCHWCDWSSVNAFLPEWLPDWSFINAARERNKGVCGMNSAVCQLTMGRRDPCGAVSAMSAVGAITAIAVAASLTTGNY